MKTIYDSIQILYTEERNRVLLEDLTRLLRRERNRDELVQALRSAPRGRGENGLAALPFECIRQSPGCGDWYYTWAVELYDLADIKAMEEPQGLARIADDLRCEIENGLSSGDDYVPDWSESLSSSFFYALPFFARMATAQLEAYSKVYQLHSPKPVSPSAISDYMDAIDGDVDSVIAAETIALHFLNDKLPCCLEYPAVDAYDENVALETLQRKIEATYQWRELEESDNAYIQENTMAAIAACFSAHNKYRRLLACKKALLKAEPR